jgi:Mg-chelatase subunit ChlD
MPCRSRPSSAVRAALSVLLAFHAAANGQGYALTAAESALVGSALEVAWQGPPNERDFITIVAIDAPEGRYQAYEYTRRSPVTLTAPQQPGAYELRYLAAASPYPTLARRPITIVDTQATLSAPATVAAGESFTLQWTGPNNSRDFIALVKADAAEGTYSGPYEYTSKDASLTLRAPDAPGAYELRYLMGATPYRTLGRLPVTVTSTAASLTVPASVVAGSSFTAEWQGPDNVRDFIAIVPAGAPARQYDAYVYTSAGNPATLAAPEIPGTYEVRYLTGQTYDTLAAAVLAVTPASATLQAPAAAPARDAVNVTWEGPGNPTDYVILLPVGSDNAASGNYAYVRWGPEVRIATPAETGEYELRYLTGVQRVTLATRPITILPRPAPGELRVLDSTSARSTLEGATVAVVLDASGSMLQRIGGERRINLAKAAITELVQDVLPSGVGFAFRVFGHKEADSCRTDLEIPPGPLDRAAATAKIASIEAMNLAKTPIAESLRLAAADVASRPRPHLFILVTDGEETCDGDPAAVIRALAASGTDVRVNIVGFAIDELMLQETFAEWARLGNGKYFNARDAAELAASLRESIEVPYAVLDAGGTIVATGTVNGPPVSVDAGTYRVVTQTAPPRTVDTVVVSIERQTDVTLP